MRGFLSLLVALALPLVAGGLGGWATASSVGTWYAGLAKPSFNPPSWVFGPVWTALYLMMGVASWLVWRVGPERPEVRWALAAYLVQLVLNGLWSFAFFGRRSPLLGLVDIVALWLALGLTILLFVRLSKPATALMLPYWAWVTFATVLNAALWRLNPKG